MTAEGDRPTAPLREKVYHGLVSFLNEGNFNPHSRLPSEDELSRMFAVSRPILRQAFERLRVEGLIYTRRGAGTFVSPRPDASQFDFGPLRSVQDVESCLVFRRTIESAAAALAAKSRTEEQLAEIQHKVRMIERAVDDEDSTIDADFLLHLEISRASNNRFHHISILAMKSQIRVGIEFVQRLSPQKSHERAAAVRAEHQSIVDAISAQDAETAYSLMYGHVDNGIQRLFGRAVR